MTNDVKLFRTEDERALVAEFTRQVLAAAAPEEIETFKAHEAAYLSGQPVTGEPGREEQLAFGEELIVPLVPYVVAAVVKAIQVIVSAFADAAGAEAKAGVTAWLRRFLHRKEAAAPLSPDVLRRVREAAYAVCQQMGADREDARLVADAVVGRLSTA